MKLKIIKEFRDLGDFTHVYRVGEAVEFTESRARQIVELGLAEEEKDVRNEQTHAPRASRRKKHIANE